jgi:hypothetical protein
MKTTDRSNIVSREFCLVMKLTNALSQYAARMKAIEAVGAVLKIFKTVVSLIAVFVIDDAALGTLADKRQHDKFMNGSRNRHRILAEIGLKVSLRRAAEFKDSPAMGLAAVGVCLSPHPPAIGHGIPALETGDGKPTLFYGKGGLSHEGNLSRSLKWLARVGTAILARAFYYPPATSLVNPSIGRA